MPTTHQSEQRHDLERHTREALDSLIREQVIHVLGEPRDFLNVSVRLLWDNNYRVNVFAGKDMASARIANSFFLAVDADGQILTSAPAITKKYERQ
jgi:ferric iron reductase protein FhuF